MLVVHGALYSMFPAKNKRMPTWLVGQVVEKGKSAQVKPIGDQQNLLDASTVLKDQVVHYENLEEFTEEMKLSTKLNVILFVSRSEPSCMQLAQ